LITDDGAALLNSKLKTKVFKAGAKFGTACTTVALLVAPRLGRVLTPQPR
jgi:hypothetical protein